MTSPDRPAGCALHTSLAAYALGALDPLEREAVAAHLPGCVICREELARVAALPGLLARVSAHEVTAGPPIPDERMLVRLLDAALARRRTRRLWIAAAVAAAVLVAGAGTGAALLAERGTTGRTVSSAQGAIRASVRLTPVSGGTALRLTLSGVAPEQTCRLVAVADDGHREVAGTWKASYAGTAHIDGSTALPAARITGFVVETFDDQVLVTLPVPAARP